MYIELLTKIRSVYLKKNAEFEFHSLVIVCCDLHFNRRIGLSLSIRTATQRAHTGWTDRSREPRFVRRPCCAYASKSPTICRTLSVPDPCTQRRDSVFFGSPRTRHEDVANGQPETFLPARRFLPRPLTPNALLSRFSAAETMASTPFAH